jgi:hypothetical protein
MLLLTSNATIISIPFLASAVLKSGFLGLEIAMQPQANANMIKKNLIKDFTRE